MFKGNVSLLFFRSLFNISKPPISGYEITEVPNERVLRQFMQYYRSKAVLLMLHSGAEVKISKNCNSPSVPSVVGNAASSRPSEQSKQKSNTPVCNSSSSSPSMTSLSSSAFDFSASAGQFSSRTVNSVANDSASVTGTALPSAQASTAISMDPLLRTFVSSMNTMNFGHPDEVKIVLVPGKRAPTFVREYQVITYPTTLLFFDGQFVDKCVGARTRELSIKSLFLLRNRGRNIFARGDS